MPDSELEAHVMCGIISPKAESMRHWLTALDIIPPTMLIARCIIKYTYKRAHIFESNMFLFASFREQSGEVELHSQQHKVNWWQLAFRSIEYTKYCISLEKYKESWLVLYSKSTIKLYVIKFLFLFWVVKYLEYT